MTEGPNLILPPPRSRGRVSSDDAWPLKNTDGLTFAERAALRLDEPEVAAYLFACWNAGNGVGAAQTALRRVHRLNVSREAIRERYVNFSNGE